MSLQDRDGVTEERKTKDEERWLEGWRMQVCEAFWSLIKVRRI